MPDPRRNPFDGVTDYISELSRMRTLGIHGEGSHSQQSAERTHASAWVPNASLTILSRLLPPGLGGVLHRSDSG